jgi:hypothetical protein
MRLVAGSSPAARTIHNQPKGAKMGYHDRRPPYQNAGIAVVNPLHEVQRKLKKIQDVLDNISDASILTANDLKIKIQKVLDD